MTPIWLSAIAAFAVLCFGVFALWVWATADSTTVIVIRHAEKEAGNLVDPPLSAAGQARAQQLAQIFGDRQHPGHLDAIYTSPALRNRLTATPLAARLGIVPIVASADDSRALVRRVLREQRGGRVMIIAHSDSVPEIVAALAARRDIPTIGDQDYGVLYIVTVPRIGHANLLRMNY